MLRLIFRRDLAMILLMPRENNLRHGTLERLKCRNQKLLDEQCLAFSLKQDGQSTSQI